MLLREHISLPRLVRASKVVMLATRLGALSSNRTQASCCKMSLAALKHAREVILRDYVIVAQNVWVRASWHRLHILHANSRVYISSVIRVPQLSDSFLGVFFIYFLESHPLTFVLNDESVLWMPFGHLKFFFFLFGGGIFLFQNRGSLSCLHVM